jgi:hypothetical protein
MHSALELTLILLIAAVLGVVAFRMLHLPPMLGYLTVGVLIGPHALGLASQSPTTHTLAEFGVVFLMFSIGLEFSLPRLRSMRRIVFGLGGAQVLDSAVVVAFVEVCTADAFEALGSCQTLACLGAERRRTLVASDRFGVGAGRRRRHRGRTGRPPGGRAHFFARSG